MYVNVAWASMLAVGVKGGGGETCCPCFLLCQSSWHRPKARLVCASSSKLQRFLEDITRSPIASTSGTAATALRVGLCASEKRQASFRIVLQSQKLLGIVMTAHPGKIARLRPAWEESRWM